MSNVTKEVVSSKQDKLVIKHMETLSTLEADYVNSKKMDGDSLTSFKRKYLFNQMVNERGDLVGEGKFVPIVTRSGRYIEVSLFVTKGHPFYSGQAIKTRPRPIIYLARNPLDYRPATLEDVKAYYDKHIKATIKAVNKAKTNPRLEVYSDIDTEDYIDSDEYNTRMQEVLEKLVFVSTALK